MYRQMAKSATHRTADEKKKNNSTSSTPLTWSTCVSPHRSPTRASAFISVPNKWLRNVAQRCCDA
ncbi:hypothetical protein SCLCIDRAFT_1215011 [Scleroderma citrinum Foug A]|uniref:Uncharacterized protein n=1 Tax=Scleroderma citrinum Foug A TaxID=1036808 RepID=A0A0C2ZLI7_9AGAM|nr:hypothetical protein SCLCIDRAFT_1215011 [Scleroderma citrinum Foug A]